MNARRCGVLFLFALLLSGCASLGALASVQAPRFEAVTGQNAELRLMGPSAQNPMGGAAVRLYARVSNPNPMGITISTLRGTLALDQTHAADVEFPLGLPLPAGGEVVIPLDVVIGFANLPGLANVVTNAITRGNVGYQLNGTVGVDAGLLGTPTFGPMTLLQGDVQARR
ncbi:LEA type 2 family protein [soil metagenome]